MIYVGVDIAKADHCLAAIDQMGRIVCKPTALTQDAEGFRRLGTLLNQLGTPETVVVGMEATGHYWVLLAEEIRRLGWQPQVFNPILTGDAGRTTVRGRKTDEDDAVSVAKVLRDGGYSAVRLPDAQMADLKRLCRYRQLAVERSANLKKRLIGYLDLVFPEFQGLFSEPYGATGRAILAKAPSARLLASYQARSFTALVRKASHGRLGLERVQQLIAAAKTSIAVTRSDTATEMAVRLTTQEIEVLEAQIVEFDGQIAKAAPTGKDLLMTIPGIGPVLAAVILAEIGSIDCFAGRDPRAHTRTRRKSGVNGVHRLLAFAGLDPRIRESGQWAGKIRMSKRGSRTLRTAIWRAAFCAQKHEAFREMHERHRLTMKQHAKVALSHVARKLVQAIYGVLRYQTAFDPHAFKHGVTSKVAA